MVESRDIDIILNNAIDWEMFRDKTVLVTGATGRLGMVYAGEDQVIYYDSSNNDYIRQYESIPGGK